MSLIKARGHWSTAVMGTEPAKGHREKKIISCALAYTVDVTSCERETISCALDIFARDVPSRAP